MKYFAILNNKNVVVGVQRVSKNELPIQEFVRNSGYDDLDHIEAKKFLDVLKAREVGVYDADGVNVDGTLKSNGDRLSEKDLGVSSEVYQYLLSCILMNKKFRISKPVSEVWLIKSSNRSIVVA